MFDAMKILWMILFALCATSVRPAHASGTVAKTTTYQYKSVSPCTYSTGASLDTIIACYHTNYGGTGSYRSGTIIPTSSSTTGWLVVTVSGGGTAGFYLYYYSASTSCPANSTGTTTCTCTDPYVPNSGATACVMPACPDTGTAVSSGYYDLGTVDNPDNHPPINACHSSCSVQYVGSAQGYRQLVAGIYHYYAQGSYVNDSSINGGTCTSGATSPSSITTLPDPTCGSGQSLVTGSNGYAKCFNDSTGDPVVSDSPEALAAKAAAESAKTVDAIAKAAAAAKAAAEAQATAAGKTPAEVTQAGEQAAIAATGAAAAASGSDQAKEKQPTDCEQHPDRLGCKDAGTPPAAEAVPSESHTVSVTPVVFSSPAGCPAPITYTMFGTTYNISFQPACDLMTNLRPVVLAIAAATAAVIMMGAF